MTRAERLAKEYNDKSCTPEQMVQGYSLEYHGYLAGYAAAVAELRAGAYLGTHSLDKHWMYACADWLERDEESVP